MENAPHWVTHKKMETKKATEEQQRAISEARILQGKVNEWWSSKAVPALVSEGSFQNDDGEWFTRVYWSDYVHSQQEYDALQLLIHTKLKQEGAPFELGFEWNLDDRSLRVEFTAM